MGNDISNPNILQEKRNKLQNLETREQLIAAIAKCSQNLQITANKIELCKMDVKQAEEECELHEKLIKNQLCKLEKIRQEQQETILKTHFNQQMWINILKKETPESVTEIRSIAERDNSLLEEQR